MSTSCSSRTERWLECDGHGTSVTPSATDACVDACCADSVFIRPVTKRSGDTINCKVFCVSSVSDLLFRGFPSAVSRFIVAVIVYATNAMLDGRRKAHVFEKQIERINPFVADRNTTSAIVLEHGGLWVKASLFHGTPGFVFFRGMLPMLQRSLAGNFGSKASAAFCLTDVWSGDRNHNAAITTAVPSTITSVSNNFKTPILPACPIFESKITWNGNTLKLCNGF